MFTLSDRAKNLSQKATIEPQLIVDIEGLPSFGARPVYKMPKIGASGLLIGGFRLGVSYVDDTAKLLINLSGSTSSISQQLNQESGRANSVSSINLELIDKDGYLTEIISPGFVIEDILTAKAAVYLNFSGGAHPDDSVPIFYGVIDSVKSVAGSVQLSISHPDGLKRQEIFNKIQTKLAGKLRYRSALIQGNEFQTQDIVGQTVTVTFIGGGTAGSEAISIAGTDLTVQIQNGVSTASQIADAISNSQAATNLVDVETTDGNDNLAQTVGGPYTLGSSTSITLDSTTGILSPLLDDTFETYIKIEDEIIKFTGISGDTLTGLVPAQFETTGKTHDIEANVETFYRLKGSMKEVALKVMLSLGDDISGVPVGAFVDIGGISNPNAISFAGIDIAERYGVTVGDSITISGATNSGNNVTRIITSISTYIAGSYVVVAGGALISEMSSSAEASFKSKYNVLPDGLGMQLDEVDVFQHEYLESVFPDAFFDYDFYLDDTVTGDTFLAEQVYFPSGCYAIPRKGRSSMGLTIPPIATNDTAILDETNVINPSQISIQRSVGQNFYNAIVYKYEIDAIKNDFVRGVITQSSDSLSRVKNVKNIPLNVLANGVRDSGETIDKIDRFASRYLDRYQFGAELISLSVKYKTGFNIEVGDTVILRGDKLKISDSSQGTRKFRPRIVEVKNKKMDIRSGTVSLDLLTTAFTVNARYGTIAPSSLVGAGATTTQIPLKRFQSTPDTEDENYKWLAYEGLKIRVRNSDYSFDEEVILNSVIGDVLNIDALSVAPLENYIIDAPTYDDSSEDAGSLWKTVHCFLDPQVSVVSLPAANQIIVSSGDVAKFFDGSSIRVHSKDYSQDTGSGDLTVESISGNTLTLSKNITVSGSGLLIDLIGFQDGGGPYRII